jgi:hypothetical protein
MSCPLSKISGTNLICDDSQCGIWDRKKEQCSILTFLQAYYAHDLLQAKLIEMVNQLNERLDDDKV